MEAMKDWNFNTSHVNVNPGAVLYKVTEHQNFNTSHVNVNQGSVVLALLK